MSKYFEVIDFNEDTGKVSVRMVVNNKEQIHDNLSADIFYTSVYSILEDMGNIPVIPQEVKDILNRKSTISREVIGEEVKYVITNYEEKK